MDEDKQVKSVDKAENQYQIINGIVYPVNKKIVTDNSTKFIKIKGIGSGTNRLGNALNDAINKFDSQQENLDLYSAKMVSINISNNSSKALLLYEIDSIIGFASLFGESVEFLWGFTENLGDIGDAVEIRIELSHFNK